MSAPFLQVLRSVSCVPSREPVTGMLQPPNSCRPGPRPGFVPFERAALDGSIPGRFEGQVDAHPGRLALGFEGEAWTYARLEHSANRIANAVLRNLRSSPAPVVLLIGQSHGLVAAVLGVLKAGGFYVPLETWYSPELAASIVSESRAGLVLADEAGAVLARAAALAMPVLRVDEILARNDAVGRPGVVVSPDTPAYVYYTSGSTGRPKGVLDSHRNVLHNVMRYTNSLGIDRDDRLTLLQSPSFSGAVSSMFAALLNGAALFPYDLRRRGAAGLERWLVTERITIYHSVPALFRLAVAGGAGLPDLRLVRLEGDRMSRHDWIAFRERCPERCVLVNGLGATECGLVRQFFVDHTVAVGEDVVPIGYPVEDMEVEVVDETGSAVAAGEVGEIVVRSRYLALGYYQRPDLTARAFSPHPEAPGVRTYRTGDLGRRRSDGCLDHLGRSDARVKIRGQWVELAEVEAALAALPGVREAAARTHSGPGGEPRLVGYLAPGDRTDAGPGELRAHLAARLAPAAVPVALVTLPSLPLTDNGKVDRAALPPPAPYPDLDAEVIAPRTELERMIAGVWADVLQLERVGLRVTFFELGGDSLGMSRVQIRLQELLGVELPIVRLFEHPTVDGLARYLEP